MPQLKTIKDTYLIDKIRIKVMEMERNELKVEFSWIKAHAEKEGNELAGRLAKEASIRCNIEECYNKIPKSAISKELKELCLKQWQNDWNTTTKGATTKSFYPNIEHRMALKVSPTPNFTTIVTGHGKINSYLHKFKIIENPVCPCNKGDQTVDKNPNNTSGGYCLTKAVTDDDLIFSACCQLHKTITRILGCQITL
jgi:hypothetical protein